MLKYVLLALLAAAVALPSSASAQSKKKKKPAPAPAVVAVPQGCPSGMTFANGTCVSEAQSKDIIYARDVNECASQIRLNWNGCTLGSFGPKAKDIFIYDQGSRGIAGTSASSDYRFKHDVTPVALLADGAVLYSFRYFGSDRTYVGVMAQQVAPIDPLAVSIRDGGYFWVDYARLGLKMQTLDEWQVNRKLQHQSSVISQ